MKRNYLSLIGGLLLIFFAVNMSPGQTNLLPNGDLETMTPNFWEKMNGDAELIWADDSYATTWPNSRRSLKIVKSAAGDNAIGWKSVNNANLYWNHAGSNGADTYNLNFAAKTTGVNTSPANDDATIGVKYTFKSGGAILAEKLVGVDQSVADKDWTDYSDAVYVSGTPDEVWLELLMGKDATGTVWFDNIDCNTNAGWTMGVFGADCEIPYGWMNWSEPHGFANFVMDESAHSGSYSALLKEEDEQSDEMVFYSEPVPAEEGKWYKVSVWARTEDISTDTTWMSTNVTPDFDDQRLGICFFFHKAPIETSWELTGGGDQFFYFDQRTEHENQDWTYYTVIAQAPEEAAGVSLRARFNNFPMGSVWYDDFSIEEVDPGENLLPNGDLETMTPNFWEKMNGDAELIWADDSYATTWPNSRRSLKIVKSAAGDNAIGWKSVNNANLYWNHAGSDGADTYNLNFAAKTTGVNTSPANDDATIGVKYTFKSGGAILAEKLVGVDQSVADKDWSDYSDAVYVSGTPDEVWLELLMGKDATGTVWFDNIDCNTNAGWTMGVFGADCEIPYGWMNWSEPHGFANFVMDESAHSGSYSALLKEEDELSDEMVFYSEPFPAEEGKWYLVSVWTKTENISTADGMFATGTTPEFLDDRMGLCFFFHKDPIETSWELTGGGDQFAYIDQRTGKENEDWTRLMVLTYGPEEAAGFSVRARFNNFPMGSVWYDDFEVCELTLIPTSIEEYGKNGVSIVTEYMLRDNYPNPFNPLTHIEYSVPKAGMVELVVYNVMGQRVRTLMSGNHAQGTFSAMWDGTDNNGNVVPSGIYFYQLQGEGAVITKKMTFLK